MAYSVPQLYSLAQGAGLAPGAAAIAAAVAMAESSGNPQAYNGAGADRSYGLWQINMIGGLGPERRARYGLSSNEQLFDPVINARVMAGISNRGTSFSAWTTYTSGKYRKFLIAAPGGGVQPIPGNPPVVQPGQTQLSGLPIFEGIPTWAIAVFGIGLVILIIKR